jgi:hypothetical protein
LQGRQFGQHGFRVHLVFWGDGVTLTKNKAMSAAQGAFIGNIDHGRRVLTGKIVGFSHNDLPETFYKMPGLSSQIKLPG